MAGRILLWVAIMATVAAAAIQVDYVLDQRAVRGTQLRPEIGPGTDTTIILVFSSSCEACTRQPEAGQIGDLIGRNGTRRIKYLGVSVDADIDDGREFLQRYAPFDEYSYGGGWGNWIIGDIIWNDSTILPAVPQLIAVERLFRADGENRLHESRTVVAREYGPAAILEWLRQLEVAER